MRRLLGLIVLLCAGCHSVHPVERNVPPKTIHIVWSADWTQWRQDNWERELRTRFHQDLVIIYVHGGYDQLRQKWMLVPDKPMVMVEAEVAVRIIHSIYPGRTVVLAACNPGHVMMYVPNTVYAVDSMWFEPGWPSRFNAFNFCTINGVGSAEELIWNK